MSAWSGLSGGANTSLAMTNLNSTPAAVALTLGNSNSVGSSGGSYSGSIDQQQHTNKDWIEHSDPLR